MPTYRQYDVLRRHPVLLAFMTRHLLQGSIEGAVAEVITTYPHDPSSLSLDPPVSQAKGPAADLACPSDHVRFTRPAIPGAPDRNRRAAP